MERPIEVEEKRRKRTQCKIIGTIRPKWKINVNETTSKLSSWPACAKTSPRVPHVNRERSQC